MYIGSVSLQSFRRFTALEIDLSDVTPRLVMLCGPNGSGKSSLFDAMLLKLTVTHGGWSSDADY